MVISQTVVEPIEMIPQPVEPIFAPSPPSVAEFEVINPPENYAGPITNVPQPEPFVVQNVIFSF